MSGKHISSYSRVYQNRQYDLADMALGKGKAKYLKGEITKDQLASLLANYNTAINYQIGFRWVPEPQPWDKAKFIKDLEAGKREFDDLDPNFMDKMTALKEFLNPSSKAEKGALKKSQQMNVGTGNITQLVTVLEEAQKRREDPNLKNLTESQLAELVVREEEELDKFKKINEKMSEEEKIDRMFSRKIDDKWVANIVADQLYEEFLSTPGGTNMPNTGKQSINEKRKQEQAINNVNVSNMTGKVKDTPIKNIVNDKYKRPTFKVAKQNRVDEILAGVKPKKLKRKRLGRRDKKIKILRDFVKLSTSIIPGSKLLNTNKQMLTTLRRKSQKKFLQKVVEKLGDASNKPTLSKEEISALIPVANNNMPKKDKEEVFKTAAKKNPTNQNIVDSVVAVGVSNSSADDKVKLIGQLSKKKGKNTNINPPDVGEIINNLGIIGSGEIVQKVVDAKKSQNAKNAAKTRKLVQEIIADQNIKNGEDFDDTIVEYITRASDPQGESDEKKRIYLLVVENLKRLKETYIANGSLPKKPKPKVVRQARQAAKKEKKISVKVNRSEMIDQRKMQKTFRRKIKEAIKNYGNRADNPDSLISLQAKFGRYAKAVKEKGQKKIREVKKDVFGSVGDFKTNRVNLLALEEMLGIKKISKKRQKVGLAELISTKLAGNSLNALKGQIDKTKSWRKALREAGKGADREAITKSHLNKPYSEAQRDWMITSRAMGIAQARDRYNNKAYKPVRNRKNKDWCRAPYAFYKNGIKDSYGKEKKDRMMDGCLASLGNFEERAPKGVWGARRNLLSLTRAFDPTTYKISVMKRGKNSVAKMSTDDSKRFKALARMRRSYFKP